jgi:hypothetical protein
MNRIHRYIALAVLAGSTTAGAAELEPYSASELHGLCQAYLEAPDEAAGRACAAFLRGFIDGSPRVVVHEEPSASERASFTERAIRTRLGRPKDPAPSYCIAGGTTLREFVTQLLTHARTHVPQPDVGAGALIMGTLDQFHRCPK